MGKTKYIFVTGGVVSSLGKGLTAGAIGMILRRGGLRVRLQKLDPYINVDPGTMNPFQHGEVYVTDDGAETDLDLGHYERFTGVPASRASNYTTGQIYMSVVEKERRGDFLGGTVQVVPHITDEIKSCIRRLADPEVDVVITEIGGTVGDIEGLPFIEAIRQMRHDEGRSRVLYVHLTLVPYLRAAGELKTKPTQQSVSLLREIGIQPDILICRAEQPLTEDLRRKIALFCNVEDRAVIEEKDVDRSIYEIPEVLIQQGFHEVVADFLGLPLRPPEMADWRAMLGRIRRSSGEVGIAVVGKYIKLQDAYKSVYEALHHAGAEVPGGETGTHVNVERIEAESIEQDGPERLSGVDGILIPGGFGTRGVEGKIAAARFAREQNIPYLGICLGIQIAVIEIARNVLGLAGANSMEFDPDTRHPVIALLDSQKRVTRMGGTMRLGAFPCRLSPNTRVREAYGGAEETRERHRHRYEINNAFRAAFEQAGVRFSGLSPDGDLVEMLELENHPWFVASQAHIEFQSRPAAPHPLFKAFVQASIRRRQAIGR
ncbi:MAG: CTP synthase [Vicinamibacteria bacterium]|nr:CTP synthase [Vicinamibacteria bacterium]